jgi:hypothetical protein
MARTCSRTHKGCQLCKPWMNARHADAYRMQPSAVSRPPARREARQGAEAIYLAVAVLTTVWLRQKVSHMASDLGALGGTRTPNLLIRSQVLYPLSYERLS